jgi:hypothetical protein
MTFVEGLFERAAFISEIDGLRLVAASRGRCASEVLVLPSTFSRTGTSAPGCKRQWQTTLPAPRRAPQLPKGCGS